MKIWGALFIILIIAAVVWVNQPVVAQEGFSCLDVSEIPQIECEALVALYISTNGANWSYHVNWLETTTPSDWYGIGVNLGRVTQVNLPYNNLIGTIPPELGNLTQLQQLELTGNLLNSAIPAELGNLINLITLHLGYNQLSGAIPEQLGYLSNLETLDLSWNQLSGAIPADLGNLNQLVMLDLQWNTLSGTIPAQLGNLLELVTMSLQVNQLTGPIPGQLGNLSNLDALYLSSNQLTGALPVQLGNLGKLTSLHLSYNNLTGAIPAELGNLAALQILDLSANLLTGAIPAQIGSLSNLKSLWLNSNQLNGAIPAQLGDLSNLQYLYLSGNQLSGSIPVELAGMGQLIELELSGNQLSGAIPAQLSTMSSLQDLSLSENQLTGAIPPELGNFNNLMYLNLSYNQLSGAIPSELGSLSYLSNLNLHGNQLTGSIPAQLGNLSSLQFLTLSSNQLTGAIPAALGNLSQLRYLDLYLNQLSGDIPAALGALSSLQSLALYNNQLTGLIPPELGNLSNLQYLMLESNNLVGPLPFDLINLVNLLHFSFHSTNLCEPGDVEFITWKNTVANWLSDGIACSNYLLKFLFVPLNWEGPQAEFDRTAITQSNLFLEELPLQNCRNQVLIQTLNVETENFDEFTCPETYNDFQEIRNFLDKNTKINPADWDVIIGLAQTSPCSPIEGSSNQTDTIWLSSRRDISTAHELGHIYGLTDQYCSNQAGSSDPRCNDGDSQNDGAQTGDVNYLDASQPCDCPPDGANDSNGHACCNYNLFYQCSFADYGICCLGNKNARGGRSTMSFGSAVGPRGFDNHELEYLSSLPELSCSPYNQNENLKFLSTADPANPILNINLTVHANDFVEEYEIRVIEGRPTSESILARQNGDYSLVIKDSQKNPLFIQDFSIYFDYYGPVVEGVDYSGIQFDAMDVSYRVPYTTEMNILELYHGDELIFSRVLSSQHRIFLPILQY